MEASKRPPWYRCAVRRRILILAPFSLGKELVPRVAEARRVHRRVAHQFLGDQDLVVPTGVDRELSSTNPSSRDESSILHADERAGRSEPQLVHAASDARARPCRLTYMRSRPGPETISGPGAHAGKQGRPRQRPGARQALDRQSAIGIVPSRYVSTTWPSGPVRGRRRSARGR
jgi:hypothetical protein